MVCTGCTMVLARKFHASRYWAEVEKYGCTLVQYIGEMARYLVTYARANPEVKNIQHKVRAAIGNGLRPDVWDDFQDGFKIPTVLEFYGATEGNGALFNVCNGKSGRGAVGFQGPIMRRVLGFKVAKYSVDDDDLVRGSDGMLVECPPGEPGELLMPIKADRPETSFAGYTDENANKKKLVSNAFVEGDQYFRSGDLLTVDSSGYYYFTDRIGDTFRWKGENVSTTEVAEVISTFPGVEEANVYGVQVPGTDGRGCCAALRCDASLVSQLGELYKHCSEQLPTYARPLFVRFQQDFDLTGTMKQVKTKLREEGCDPSKMGPDPLYWLNPLSSSYEPLTQEIYGDLAAHLSKTKARL
mmetsp:Transcript_32875/g.71722  ORF Transcript_32875/g.71722 Transcript_32875/m.71722 type:complete len:356 (+) Transcript_32875:3-1070(+)